MLTLAGCTGTHRTAVPETSATSATSRPPRTIELPGNSWPRELAMAPDGTLWVVESSIGFLASISPSGRVTQHHLTDALHAPSLDPGYLTIASDGSVWFSCALDIGRITPDGTVRLFHDPPLVYGSPDTITAGSDGSVWYGGTTADGWRLVHVTAKLVTSHISVPLHQFGPHITGLAFGPGERLWFTSSPIGNERGEVGYTDSHGHTRIWTTDDPFLGPIVPGPDGALWFAERAAIGRITPSGSISYHRAPKMKYTGGLVSGPGNALWFTTSTSLGRITTTGTITLWPIPGARELTDLVYDAHRHGFWVADAEAAVLRWAPLPP
ncbi:Vgb family protein [Streptomyces murinus]|uniref:Vgb family protein n=1 Tax=Streptomyces murinus TaxID=33900 RepID=UPI00372A377A